MSKTRIYGVWTSMIARCTNPNQRSYGHYGGRGITIDPRWLKFQEFYKDMGHPPSGMSLDRIDVNGDYEPTNCRWATWKTQQRNRRNNRTLELNGQAKSIAEWSEDLGIKTVTILSRLGRGWSDEMALTTPVNE